MNDYITIYTQRGALAFKKPMTQRCFHCKAVIEGELPYACMDHLFVVRLCSDQCLTAHQQEHLIYVRHGRDEK